MVTCPGTGLRRRTRGNGSSRALTKPGGAGALDPYADLDDGPALQGGRTAALAAAAADGRRPCPMCGEMIVAGAAKCRYCGEVFDSTLKKVKKSGGKKGAMKSIATLQKYLLICSTYYDSFVYRCLHLWRSLPTCRPSPDHKGRRT